ncbi:MAG: hypothetical protein MJK08_01720 [Campylobacterales bacterium]|nr:hypothetical protein [Campylobacterales bacterium]
MKVETSYNNIVQEVHKIKTSYNKEQEIEVIYNNYSLQEIREIPFEEAKENYDQIIQRINAIKKSEQVDGEKWALRLQYEYINMTNDTSFNKAVYNTMQNTDDRAQVLSMYFELNTNLSDYYYGKDMYASFVVSNDNIHAHKSLTQAQHFSINYDKFISKMLDTFTKDYEKAPGSVREQYKNLVDMYSDIQNTYSSSIKESYYA